MMSRKTTRQLLAFGTLAGFFAYIGVFCWLAATIPAENKETIVLLDKIFVALLGLTSTVMTFYFTSGSDET